MAICKNCTKEFTIGKAAFGIYCSNRCQAHYQSRTRFNAGLASNSCARRNLIEQFGKRCSICFNDSWLSKEIPLVVDHIDGNSNNNQPSNLRLVCPNCDAQLPTYKNRNKGNGRHSRMKRYYEGKSY